MNCPYYKLLLQVPLTHVKVMLFVNSLNQLDFRTQLLALLNSSNIDSIT